MINVQGLNQSKERILAFLRARGPSLPVHIARDVKAEPLFVSAFLSELKNERKLKISDMKVGSSPLYYLEGQEEMLGNFIEHLNSREREAFNLLKSERVLSDEGQEPVVRVALRALKDFAVPVKARIGGEMKLFWKYFGVGDEEVGRFVRGGKRTELEVSHLPIQEVGGEGKFEERVPAHSSTVSQDVSREHSRENTANLGISVGGSSGEDSGGAESEQREKKVKQGGVRTEQEVLQVRREVIKQKPKKVKESSEFVIGVKNYLKGRDIEVLEILSEKKKEFEARVRVDSLFGKQEYLLIAKDKKNVSDGDLGMAVQKATAARVLGLVMSPGELNKKGQEHLKDWGELVKFEKMKF